MKLSVDNLSTPFLKGISFEVHDENAVILGSNGAGKTTLAKALVGLYETSSVLVEGEKLASLGSGRRAQLLNFVPSGLDVFDEYIDAEAFLNLSLLNGSTPDDLETVMARLNITGIRNTPCRCLSSGESQLLLFAGGLLHNARLTIFDEPTANLDSDKKIKLFGMLKEHLGWKIIITHDLNLAYRLGYRILYLREGELVFDGSATDFFEESHFRSLFGESICWVGGHFVVNYG
ncbi:ABC transporter ATP-binding protein [Sulfuricurvum sp.]|uniref:ATP-binding cassette domain-containing protein n=1 Tax=Sulfuricurvum sp. TaxID=2025608 RepID=UPI0019CAB554|nr:ABC transporter ATP-binding protein [Sulfuricurvum sp.]MBD3806801.1 ABC transporter ATP-binding protein [Sulfuricurvum sp.]